jgi:exodeoxyribonuclease-3
MFNEQYFICWNVNGIRAWSKKGSFEWVLDQSPDFFCIQETKAHPDQLSIDLLSPEGYTSYFDHSKLKKGYSGVAVYTKKIPESVDMNLYVLNKDTPDQEGRFIALYFKDFVLINCYFPNGGGLPQRLEYKLKFYDAFLNYVNKLKNKGLRVVVCGDLNVAHNEIDIARPKENQNHVGFLPIERKWFDKVEENNFVDTYRYLYPEKVEYSWWDVKTRSRDRNIGWRIDYFVVDMNTVPRIKDAKIHTDIFGSDHCPISLKLSL